MGKLWSRITESLNKDNNNVSDFYKGTQGAKLVSKNAWNTSKDLQKSIKEQQTYIESPTSNRWIGAGGKESLAPKVGNRRVQTPSTAIQDVIYDPKTNTASVMFVDGKKYYDYEVTPEQMEEFVNAPSKGHLVATEWNHNPAYRKEGYNNG
jgi:hypothetical protein